MVALVRRFGLYGQIQVFHLGFLARGFDPLAQLRGQFSLLLDGFEHRDLALLQLAEVGELFLNRPDLHLVQFTGLLLAVAGDKGHRGPFLQQFNGMFHLKRFEAGRFDDIGNQVCGFVRQSASLQLQFVGIDVS